MRLATVIRLRSRGDRPGRSHTSPNKTLSVYSASAGAMCPNALRALVGSFGMVLSFQVLESGVVARASGGRDQQRHRDNRRAEHNQRAGEKDRTEAGAARDQPQRRAAKAERHVEEHRVDAHDEATALRRGAADGFDAKA